MNNSLNKILNNFHNPDRDNWCVCSSCLEEDSEKGWTKEIINKWQPDLTQFSNYLQEANLDKNMNMCDLTLLFRELYGKKYYLAENGMSSKNGERLLQDSDNNILREYYSMKRFWLNTTCVCIVPPKYFKVLN